MPRMNSSMPRSSNETWCSEVCGPRAKATEWWRGLQRMKFITVPVSGPASVSDSRKPSTSEYQRAVASGSVQLSTTWDSRTGIGSRSSILRCRLVATSALTSTVRPSVSKKRRP